MMKWCLSPTTDIFHNCALGWAESLGIQFGNGTKFQTLDSNSFSVFKTHKHACIDKDRSMYVES